MAWLTHGEKKFDDMFIRFDTTHERDRHTDRQTDKQTPHDGIASRGNNRTLKTTISVRFREPNKLLVRVS